MVYSNIHALAMLTYVNFNVPTGQSYCLSFHYFINGSGVQVAIYEDDTWANRLDVWFQPTSTWTPASHTFIAQAGQIPVLDIWYSTGTGNGAVDDVTLTAGACTL